MTPRPRRAARGRTAQAPRRSRTRDRVAPESAAHVAARFVSRHPLAFALGLAALHLVLAAAAFQPAPFTGGDNAAYVTLARSLLEHHAYLNLYDPAMPPHTQYPPVFPGILAIALALGLQPWVQLKILIVLFSAAAIALTFLWIRRRHRPLLAVGVAGLLAVSPGVIEQSHWVLSDVPFWCLTMLALWAWERLPRHARGWLAIAVLATVLAYFTRSAGLPLVLAAFAWLALRRRWRQLGILAAVILPLAFLWWLRAHNQGGVDYVSQFWFVNPYDPSLGRIGAGDLVRRIIDNDRNYLRIHLPILLVGRTGALMTLASVLTVALAAYGWGRRLRRPGLVELFLPLYLGLLSVWPAVWSGERFLLPAMPALLFYAGDGLVRVARAIRPRTGLAAGLVAAGILLVLDAPGLNAAIQAGQLCTAEYRGGQRYPCLAPAWREFFEMADWSEDALPADASVLSRKPRLFYAISGLHGRIFPFVASADSLIAAAADARSRYVLVDRLDRLSQAYLVPSILARPHVFCLIHATPGGGATLLGLLPGADTLPDSPAQDGGNLAECPADFTRTGATR